MKPKSIVLTLLLGFLIFNVQAQEKKKIETIDIKTSAICESCKKRIETALYNVDGVKSAELNLENKIITVKYKPAQTDPDKIRKAISLVGYDADDVPADPQAYEKLPGCCQKGGH